jgi:GntR family transcriptional regulator / MocR family aminotransferase
VTRFAVTETPSGLPLFQRVAESVAEEIRRGRIRPGERLPSSRALARDLDVHRNTVLAAYDELERQGYLETRPARGTFAASDLPQHPTQSVSKKCRPVRFSLPSPPPIRAADSVPEDVIMLVPGLPDLRELPLGALARAYRAALRAAPNTLDYQSMYGHPRLLQALSEFLRDARGVVVEPGGILATRGSQQALYLAARALTKPGAVIAVEQYGYQPAWEAFRLAGATLAPVPVDRQGLVVSRLKPLAAQGNLAAVYVTPHHQYPTTVTMSAARRMELLELARTERFCILEDDYDHEFHFTGRPVLPLASADTSGVVVHVGSLSKVLAPGLRVGFAVAQAPIVESMALHRRYLDRQGDHALELALAYLIEDGELGAHIRRMHRAYAERRDVLHQSLRETLSGALSFRVPSGGIALWARVTCQVKPERWCEAALKQGVLVHAGRRHRFDGASTPFLRLGYARHTPEEIRDGVRRLAQALEHLHSRNRSG